jgi:hypothetical protein
MKVAVGFNPRIIIVPRPPRVAERRRKPFLTNGGSGPHFSHPFYCGLFFPVVAAKERRERM